MARYPFAEWSAEHLRLTAFPLAGTADLPVEHWWDASVGSPADEVAANLKAGTKTLASTFHTGRLVLKLEPGRVDWLFVPQDPDPTAASLPDAFPGIGQIAEGLDLFSEIATAWLSLGDIPDLMRVAFGAVVRHSEADRRSAYIHLADYLPFIVDPDASDFNFQLNVPALSGTGVDGLRMNRLSKWSVAALSRLAFQVHASRMTSATPQTLEHAIRVELDINTSPEFQGPLPRARLIEVYNELVALGSSIVKDGLPQ